MEMMESAVKRIPIRALNALEAKVRALAGASMKVSDDGASVIVTVGGRSRAFTHTHSAEAFVDGYRYAKDDLEAPVKAARQEVVAAKEAMAKKKTLLLSNTGAMWHAYVKHANGAVTMLDHFSNPAFQLETLIEAAIPTMGDEFAVVICRGTSPS